MGWGAQAPPSCLLSALGDPRVPGLMAAAGTWGAGGAFAAQKEVVLERLCWLDGGCERARRGYLYGQLCCVGGCGCKGWWRRMGHQAPPGTATEAGRGWRPVQVQPRPHAVLRKHLGRKVGGGTVPLDTFVPSLEKGGGGGRGLLRLWP